MTENMLLRDVTEFDLPTFYEQQLDPDACLMADFPSRDWETFERHWAHILCNETIIKKTILVDGHVAGNIVSFRQHDRREVGYWLGRQFWGRGLATRALAAFLGYLAERPLYAYVATHNTASRRVLEKCGFRACGEEDGGIVLMLQADEPEHG